jgi:hypothetical protein
MRQWRRAFAPGSSKPWAARHSAANHSAANHSRQPDGHHHERGSAVVEFTFLALLLMVPLVYFIITVSQCPER